VKKLAMCDFTACVATLYISVARWYIFIPKSLCNLKGPWNGKCGYIEWSFGIVYGPFGIFCGRLVDFVVVWNIFTRFGLFNQDKSGNPVVHAF
jgi:hypothetical protein